MDVVGHSVQTVWWSAHRDMHRDELWQIGLSALLPHNKQSNIAIILLHNVVSMLL